MRNIDNTYMKFTDHNGSDEYVSIREFYDNHQDSYQGWLSEELYQWIDGPRGWAFYPIQ